MLERFRHRNQQSNERVFFDGVPASRELERTIFRAEAQITNLRGMFGFSQNSAPFNLNLESANFLNLFIQEEMVRQLSPHGLLVWNRTGLDDKREQKVNEHYAIRYENLLSRSSISTIEPIQKEILHAPLRHIASLLVEKYRECSENQEDISTFDRGILLAECEDTILDYQFREKAFTIPHPNNIPRQERTSFNILNAAEKAQRTITRKSKDIARKHKNIIAAGLTLTGVFGTTYAALNSNTDTSPYTPQITTKAQYNPLLPLLTVIPEATKTPQTTPLLNKTDIIINAADQVLAHLTDGHGKSFRQVMAKFGYSVSQVFPTETRTARAGDSGLRVRPAPTIDDPRVLSTLGVPGYIDSISAGTPVTWFGEIEIQQSSTNGQGPIVDRYGILLPPDQQVNPTPEFIRLIRYTGTNYELNIQLPIQSTTEPSNK